MIAFSIHGVKEKIRINFTYVFMLFLKNVAARTFDTT